MASYTMGKEWVILYLKTHFPKNSSVLDVGCCNGLWYDLLSDYFQIDGVEAFEPNIYNNSLYTKYNNIYCSDITKFKYPKKYDIIIFGDIIEHLEIKQAQLVIEKAKKYAKEIIVAVPYNFPQDEIYGNPYEIHKQADLTRDIFNDRYPGFDILYEIPNIYCYFKLAVNENNFTKSYFITKSRLDLLIYSSTKVSQKDYIYITRYFLDLIYIHQNLNSTKETIYMDLNKYGRVILEQLVNGIIPDFRRVWIELYKLFADFELDTTEIILKHIPYAKVKPLSKLYLDVSPEIQLNYINDYIEIANILKMNYNNIEDSYNMLKEAYKLDKTNDEVLQLLQNWRL